MFARSKSVLLAAAFVFLFSAVATAQHVPRIELDWEPHPKDKSYVKVVCDPCCNPKIVCLIGGKKIRPRALTASSQR